MQLTKLFLTISVFLFALQTKAQTSLSCNPEMVPAQIAGKEAQDIISWAALSETSLCEKIQAYNDLMIEYPLDFVRQDLFFKLLQLEKKAGLSKKAVQTYMEWPWQSQYSPWSYLAEGEEPAVRLMLFQIFQAAIPTSSSLCIQNLLTAKCDEGQGLANYDQQFVHRFPDSPLLQQMKEAVRPFYEFKLQKEMGRVKSMQKSYDSDFHPHHLWDRLADSWQKAPSSTAALKKCRIGKGGGKNDCFIIFQQNQLSALLLQLLRTENLAHPEDRDSLRPLIRGYAQEMKSLLAKHPEIKNEIAPDLRPLNWDNLIQSHAD